MVAASMLLWSVVACHKTDPAAAAQLQENRSRIERLEARVAQLEGRGAAAPAGEPDAATQEAAADLLRNAMSAMHEDLDVESARQKLAELAERYPNSDADRGAKRVRGEIAVVGREEGPLLVDAWYQGSPADLEGGKATLWVFWEVWCPHCVREVPKLSAIYDQYGDQGLRVVALTKRTRNTSEEQVRAFIEDEGLTVPVAWEQGDAMSKYYGVSGIPAAAVTRDGVVVWRGHPAQLGPHLFERFLE